MYRGDRAIIDKERLCALAGRFMGTIPNPKVVDAEGGKPLDVLGDTIIRKVGPEDSGGAFAVYKEVSPPGGGAPLHVHEQTDEIFYVLEGEYEVTCGQQTFSAKAGTYAVLPRGKPHAFTNLADTPSSLLITIMPGEYFRFFEEVDTASKSGSLDDESLATIAQRHDIRVL